MKIEKKKPKKMNEDPKLHAYSDADGFIHLHILDAPAIWLKTKSEWVYREKDLDLKEGSYGKQKSR